MPILKMNLPTVKLTKGREKKIRNRYPWVQREEVKSADAVIQPGTLARLVDFEDKFLALGSFNPNSRFPFRVITRQEEPIDEEFFAQRFKEARARREGIEHTNAVRELFAEADALPGLIADRYDRTMVVQVRHAGMELLKPFWLPALIEEYQPEAVVERSDMEGRRDEGMPPFSGVLHGEVPEIVAIEEDGLKFHVPVMDGLKTGFYLDQRETRRRLSQRVRPGEKFLDCFCYLGAFSLAAREAGATTLGLDIHEPSIERARQTAVLNGLDCEYRIANAFEWLEAGEERGYDWIMLDPPAIAKRSEKRDALKWAIWKLVYHAIPLLKPGGRLIVCSCTYQMSQHELVETARLAAADQGKAAFLEEVTFQSPDHPILMAFPESFYLKCAWIRIEG